jgi:hypothetical protein
MPADRLINRRNLVLAGLAMPLAGAWPGAAAAQLRITRRTLTGVWRGTVEVAGVSISGEVIFDLDGTYRRMHWLGQLRTWQVGPYSIANNWIHFEVDDYEPKFYQGVYQHPPPSETWMVDFFDGRIIEGRIGEQAQFRYRKAE